MYKFLFFLLTIALITGCNKDKNNYLFAGSVFSPNENKNVYNATVELQAQLIENGTYNSNYQKIQSVETDEGGNYTIVNENVRASSFKLVSYADNYIKSEKIIAVDDVILGEEYHANFSIFPKAYLNIYVKNVVPVSANDEITITIEHNSPNCTICSNITNLVLSGDAINDTLIYLVYGNQTVTVNYITNTSQGLNSYNHQEYCTAFETTEYTIYY